TVAGRWWGLTPGLDASGRVKVGDRRGEARQQLERRCAGLEPAAGRRRGRRAGLVRAPRLEELRPAVRDSEVRAAELVRRTEQDVAAERIDVDPLVSGVVHGVDPGDCARLVSGLADSADVGDGADRVPR